jgi:hypothetical protein
MGADSDSEIEEGEAEERIEEVWKEEEGEMERGFKKGGIERVKGRKGLRRKTETGIR